MHWKFKAAVFRGLAVTPFGNELLYQLQRRVTREMPRRLDVLHDLLAASQKVLDLYRSHGAVPLARASYIEIGAGRDLAVALALRMRGVGRVVCLDIERLARLELVQHAARHLAQMMQMQAPLIGSWSDLADFGIEYLAPARLQGLPDRSFDCFYTIDTLEHIPVADLRTTLEAAASRLAPSAVSIHAIDYGDHYARSHAGLSRFNFLAYSQRQWAGYNPSMHYVNRLRHSEFLDLFRRCGYEIEADLPDRRPIEPQILARLAPEFARFDHEDLFTLRAWVVARLAEAASAAASKPPRDSSQAATA